MNVEQGPDMPDPFWKQAVWTYTFALIPKRCAKTNKWLWLQTVAEGSYILRYDPTVTEYKYIDKNEFLMLQLQGGIKNGIH